METHFLNSVSLQLIGFFHFTLMLETFLSGLETNAKIKYFLQWVCVQTLVFALTQKKQLFQNSFCFNHFDIAINYIYFHLTAKIKIPCRKNCIRVLILPYIINFVCRRRWSSQDFHVVQDPVDGNTTTGNRRKKSS